MSGVINIKQAAEFLGVSENTLRNWDVSGKLKAGRHHKNNYRTYTLEQLRELQLGTRAGDIKQEVNERALVRKFSNILRDSGWSGDIIQRFEEAVKILAVSHFINSNGNSNVEIKTIQENNDLLGKINNGFHSRFNMLGINQKILDDITENADIYSLTKTELGLVFEELIKNTFDKGEHQQFFTPPEIVEFLTTIVCKLLPSEKPISICDPASGTGGFLVEFHKTAIQNKVKIDTLYGFEIDERLAWACKHNLIMHGADVEKLDIRFMPSSGSLGENFLQSFDQLDSILTNPPFGSDVKNPEILKKFVLGKNKSSRRRGILFIERCINLVKSGGVIGIVVEESILNSSQNTDVRNLIFSECYVRAVIKLPDTSFKPYASVSTSILVLQKKGDGVANSPTFFAKSNNIGRRGNGEPDIVYDSQINMMNKNTDLPLIEDMYDQFLHGQEITNSEDPFCYTYSILEDASGERMDFAFHNPTKYRAKRLINSAKYESIRLRELINVRNQPTILSKEYGNSVNFVGLGDIESATGQFKSRLISPLSMKSTVRRFEPGDLLLSKMRPSLRKIVFIPKDSEGGFCSSECIVMTPNISSDKIVLPELLSLILRSDLFYGQVIHKVTGIGRPRISKKNVLDAFIPIPPMGVQKEILVGVKLMESQMEELNESITRIQEEVDLLHRDRLNYFALQVSTDRDGQMD